MSKNGRQRRSHRNPRALSWLALETRHPSTNFVHPLAGAHAFAGSILPESGGLLLSFVLQLPEPAKRGPKVTSPAVDRLTPAPLTEERESA
jgi:hypothetical protein